MPNVYIACWTMNTTMFNGSTASDRADELLNIAYTADTHLKLMGNIAGVAYTRMLVVPEYYFAAGGSIASRSDKHVIYRRLENISAQVPQLVLIAGTIAYEKGLISRNTYNVCPVLLNGQIIKKLYKANDDGVYQVNGTFRTKTDHGKAAPLFVVNGISVGVDICMDYLNDRLGGYLAAQHIAAPDVHIQISGTNGTFANRALARVGGVYLHCDLGGKGANGATAWRITVPNPLTGDITTRILPTATLTPNAGGRLMLFDTPV